MQIIKFIVQYAVALVGTRKSIIEVEPLFTRHTTKYGNF